MDYDYKVLYSDIFNKKLDDFYDYMDRNCIYRDTGLYNEELIIQNYQEFYRSFKYELKKLIDNTVGLGVFGVIESKTEDVEQTKLVVFPRSYNVTLKCKKMLKEKIFIIEDIIIRS